MITAGIDVSKASLVAAVDGRDGTFATTNDAAGWRKLAGWLAAGEVGEVGLEATGGYERGAAASLARAGVDVRIVDPAGARAFARSMGVRAKNDRIDAAQIARYTASLAGEARPRDARIEPLSEELRLIEQLEEDRARWKTRAESYSQHRLASQARTRARQLQRNVMDRLRRLEASLRRHADLAERLDLLLSIPGIAERTAIALVIHMPELGRLTREQAAALVGVAPHDRDSGTFRGQRRITGGRPRLRRALYNAAGMARRWNSALAACYARLIARGKHHCCAMIACVRKLIIFANAVLARGTPWTKTTMIE